ncbi:HAD hydrolase-like protein [Bacillus sp. sid0103]|nr:HAD hydrolase-like protein [Bacillus sp. sid0103]
MFQRASTEHQLALDKCVVIGDRWTDMVAAHQTGCRKILVQTGAGIDAIVRYRNKWTDIEPDYVAKDLMAA